MRRRTVLLGAAAAAATVAPPGVVVLTALGPIRMRLYPDRAPLSCADFLQYIATRAYDGGRFFRTVRPDNDHGAPKIDVIQGGIRPGVKVGPSIAHEGTGKTGLLHVDGTVSLPRDTPGSASGAEIFICIGAQPALDAGGMRNPDRQGFAAFGRVVDGMDVVRRIWGMKASGRSDDAYTAGQILSRPVEIISARRV